MNIIVMVGSLLVAMAIHEYAHGQVAYWLGDPTAKYAGRLTLNPLAHIDPFGTIILPIILIIMGLFPVAYAKPVPINYGGLNNPKKDIIWIGLAGPSANILLAIVSGFVLRIMPDLPPIIIYILGFIVLINVLLAVFNLIPIPPLDGSRVMFGLLPSDLARQYISIERYGIFIIYGLVFLGLFRFIIPIVFNLCLLIGGGKLAIFF